VRVFVRDKECKGEVQLNPIPSAGTRASVEELEKVVSMIRGACSSSSRWDKEGSGNFIRS